jgi:trans-aconitate 2-methyltransferase
VTGFRQARTANACAARSCLAIVIASASASAIMRRRSSPLATPSLPEGAAIAARDASIAGGAAIATRDAFIANRQPRADGQLSSCRLDDRYESVAGCRTMYTWNPRDYAQHSRGQEAWAQELLALLHLRPNDVVLDIGCGDGRTTRAIAKRVPEGRVVGVDLSAEMVAHAAAEHCHPPINNLRFAQADAAALPFTSEFSAVFSNATLHWVPDQRAAVHGIARALQPDGRVVAQFGGQGNVAEVIAAFEHVSGGPRWRSLAVPGELPYRFHSATTYESWLREAGFDIQECRLIPKDMVHQDTAAFIGWLRTAWHPYTAGVPLELRDAFLEETARHYLSGHPPDAQGHVHAASVRLQVRARKVPL